MSKEQSTTQVPGWVSRLVEEYEELKRRHSNLKTFVNSAYLKDLDPTNQKLLIEQESVMEHYAQILLTRISLVKVN